MRIVYGLACPKTESRHITVKISAATVKSKKYNNELKRKYVNNEEQDFYLNAGDFPKIKFHPEHTVRLDMQRVSDSSGNLRKICSARGHTKGDSVSKSHINVNRRNIQNIPTKQNRICQSENTEGVAISNDGVAQRPRLQITSAKETDM